MRKTDVPKHNLIYGRAINPRLKINGLESMTLCKNYRVKILQTTNGNKVYPIKLTADKDDSISECPFLFTRNAIIINDYYPDRDEWLALLTMREFRSNFTKIHWFVRCDKDKHLEYENAFEEALKAVYRNRKENYCASYNIPTIVVYSHIEYSNIRDTLMCIDKGNLIKLLYDRVECGIEKKFTISSKDKKIARIMPYSYPILATGAKSMITPDYMITVEKGEN